MDSYVLLILALIGANVPFLSRWFFLVPVRRKNSLMEIVEFLAYYFVLNLVAYFLETRRTDFHVQEWEFYVTTLSFFTILAFPAFAYRYFWRWRGVAR